MNLVSQVKVDCIAMSRQTRPPKARPHDVFLSYSRVDRIYAEKLAADLQRWGITVWWDKGEILVGDSLTSKVQDGLAEARWLAVILTPQSVNSEWVRRELGGALVREFERRQVVVLPLLFRDCELPPFLADKEFADFRESYEEGFRRLLERLDPPIQVRLVQRLLSEDRPTVLATYEELSQEVRGQYRRHLLDRLSDSSGATRSAAIFALWAIGDEYLPLALLAGLRDVSDAVRRQTVFLMGETRDAIYGRIIAGLLSDGNPQIRQAAREAHGKTQVSKTRPDP